jgi:hypothetical protein
MTKREFKAGLRTRWDETVLPSKGMGSQTGGLVETLLTYTSAMSEVLYVNIVSMIETLTTVSNLA